MSKIIYGHNVGGRLFVDLNPNVGNLGLISSKIMTAKRPEAQRADTHKLNGSGFACWFKIVLC